MHLRDAEVGEHCAAGFFVEQDVGRFDVAMDDTVAMRTFECVGELGENAMRFMAGQPPFHAQTFGQRDAAHVRHDEIPQPAHFTERVQRKNSRM